MSKKQINFDLFNVKKNKSLKNRKGKSVSGNINIMSSLRKNGLIKCDEDVKLYEYKRKTPHCVLEFETKNWHRYLFPCKIVGGLLC